MSDNLIIQEVLYGSELYEQTVALRHDILRKPLGLEFTPEQLAEEYDSWHLAAFNQEGALLACLILKPLQEPGQVKMRQVAVKASEQGKGVGSVLVEASEAIARERGRLHIVLHARERACKFYQRLGYTIVGEQFEEVGIPHFRMEKILR